MQYIPPRTVQEQHTPEDRSEDSSPEPPQAVSPDIPRKKSRIEGAGSSTMEESSSGAVQLGLPWPAEQSEERSQQPREPVPRSSPKKRSSTQISGSGTMGESSLSTVQRLPLPAEQSEERSQQPREPVPRSSPKKRSSTQISGSGTMGESSLSTVQLLPLPAEQSEERSQQPREPVPRSSPKKRSSTQISGSGTMGESSLSTVQLLPLPAEQSEERSQQPREPVLRSSPKKRSSTQVSGSGTMGESSLSTVQLLPLPAEQSEERNLEPREPVARNIPKKRSSKEIAGSMGGSSLQLSSCEKLTQKNPETSPPSSPSKIRKESGPTFPLCDVGENLRAPFNVSPEVIEQDPATSPPSSRRKIRKKSSRTFSLWDMDESLRAHFNVSPELFEQDPAVIRETAFGVEIGTSRVCISQVGKDQSVKTFHRLMFEYENDPESLVRFSSTHVQIGDNYKCPMFQVKNAEVCGLLRLAGLRYDAYVRELSRYWPFNVVDIDGWPHMECTHNGKLCHISPETLLYEILRYFRQFAMKVCGEEDPFFVIAVAGSCTYNQRRAINRAANRAELKSILINDTSAVMISRWLTFRYREHGICVVVDIGGGSVSITSFMVSQYRVRVLSNVGDCHWGGDDFDNTIMSYCFEKMRELMGGDLSSLDKKILRKKCIAAKLELSKEENTTVCLHEHRVEISREMFESWNAERFRQLSALIKRCIKRTKLQKFEILRAFKHGRCCLIPRLSQIIDEHLAPTITVKYDSVSRGAAIYAGMKTGMYYKTVWKTELELKELTPVISVGLHNTKVRKMVERAYLPQSRFRVFRYSAPEVCEVRLNVYELDNKFVRQQILIGGISLLFAQSIIRQSLSLVIFTVTRTFFEVTVYAEDLDNRYSRLELSRHFGDEGRPDQRNWLRALTPLDDMLVRLDSPAQTVDLNSEDNEVNIVTRHIHNRTLIVEGPRPCGCVLYSLNSVFQSCELVLTVTPPQPPAAVNTPVHPYLPPEAVPDVHPQYEGVPDLTRRDAHAPNVRRPHEYGEMIHPAHPNLPIQTDPHLLEHYTRAGNLSRQPEIQPVVYNPQQYERRSEAVPEIRRPDVALQDVTADYVTRESVIQTVMYNPQQYERRSEAGPEIRRPEVPLRDVRADYVPRESVIQTVMHNPQQYERRSEAGPDIRRPDVPLQDVRADYETRESVIQTVMHNPQQYERRSEAGPEIRRPDVPLQDVRAGYVTREPETQPAMYNPQQYERRLEAGPEIRRPDVPLQDVRAGYVTREPETQSVMYNPQQYERRSEAGPEMRRPDVPLQDVRAGYVTREPETQPVMYNPQQYERRLEAGPEIRRPDVPLQDVRAGYVTREPVTQPAMYNPQQYERRSEAGPEIRRPDVPLQDVRAGYVTREPETQPVMYNPQQYERRLEAVPQIRRPDVPLQDVRAGYGSRVPEIQPVVYNPQQYEPRTGPIPQIQWPNIPFQDVRPGYGSRVPEIQPVVYNPQQYERRSETVPEIRRPHVPLQDVRAGYATREPEIQPVMYNPQQYEPRTGPIPEIQWHNIPFQDVRPGYGSRIPEIQPVVNFRGPDMQPVTYISQQYLLRMIHGYFPITQGYYVQPQVLNVDHSPRRPDMYPSIHNPQQDRQAVRASYYRPEVVPVRTQRELSNPFTVPADHRYQSSIQEEAIERLPHETFEAEPIVNLDPNTDEGQESADSSILDNHEVLINVSDMRETQVIPVVGDNEGTITGSDASMEIVELDEESFPEGEEPLSQEAEVQDSPLNLSTGSTEESEIMPASGENQASAPDVIVSGPRDRIGNLPVSIPISQLNLPLLSGCQITIRMPPSTEFESLDPNAGTTRESENIPIADNNLESGTVSNNPIPSPRHPQSGDRDEDSDRTEN
ncbi:uncharacterized protein LOC124367844 isoform X2 [Homalodisca vitripennis]|uniref:uncharacterized protein LOC124367844 isoform X2 n=1 Tax=Homalodisca vitripennis TaxID=197043 RepID=UPI001EE9CECB|nr:uncharacterized protein LOC124367844 isoform X2 [Homalodisca vitripennis]